MQEHTSHKKCCPVESGNIFVYAAYELRPWAFTIIQNHQCHQPSLVSDVNLFAGNSIVSALW